MSDARTRTNGRAMANTADAHAASDNVEETREGGREGGETRERRGVRLWRRGGPWEKVNRKVGERRQCSRVNLANMTVCA